MSNFKWLAGFCGIYLVISTVLFFSIPSFECHKDIDSGAYIEPTETFEQYGSFIIPEKVECTNYCEVVYPLFMVVIRAVFGHNCNAVIWVQILLAMLMIIMIFNICMRLFSRNIALVAAFFASINMFDNAGI